MRQNNEANKEKNEAEKEVVQSAKDGMEGYLNDEIANMEENELRRRRNRLL